MAVIKKEVTERVCDICGLDADGVWHSTSYLNGEVGTELSCPIDLCKGHMTLYAYHYTSNHEYVQGRGETFDKQEELIEKMKQDKYRDDYMEDESNRYRGSSYLNW